MFRILIVEDDSNTSRLMRLVLKRAGYEPLQAENGAIALEMLDREHVDLIVLDVMMPVMDAAFQEGDIRRVRWTISSLRCEMNKRSIF